VEAVRSSSTCPTSPKKKMTPSVGRPVEPATLLERFGFLFGWSGVARCVCAVLHRLLEFGMHPGLFKPPV
jgi:hypothetical protein